MRRRDLVGLSDTELATRVRHAIAHQVDDVAELAAEANRRDLLARHFPGGNLAGDLADVGDDALAWCMQYATRDELVRIAGEMDRRDAVDLPRRPPQATSSRTRSPTATRSPK
ncbi:hypothetical protein [Streptomyces sp. NPDC056690]|uniref:hypothetical protein n=1 Tax=unclassified Streptomyces TaxID=2593676 RepID=UPI0036444360